MSEDKVLISRTRVNKEDWNKLKLIAQILSKRTKKDISREDLINHGLKSTVKYFEQKLEL